MAERSRFEGRLSFDNPWRRSTSCSSIFHLKRGTFLRSTLSPVIQPRRGNVGMPQPLLHFGNVRVMRERIRGSSSTQRMYAETMHVSVDAHHGTIVLYNLLVHRRGIKVFCAMVAWWRFGFVRYARDETWASPGTGEGV